MSVAAESHRRTTLTHAELARDVQPEWLDTLPADDPRARRSRADLRRLNRIMGAFGTLRQALDDISCDRDCARFPLCIVELGAGDGSLMARLAHARGVRWPHTQVTLIDLQPVVAPQTAATIEHAGWSLDVVRSDVFDWLRNSPRHANEIIIANLFVHHFLSAQITELLSAIAARASAFVCCEPRRSRTALLASRCLGAIGCNDVTRHDAVASVRAGFRDRELAAAWPALSGWTLDEAGAGMFLHRFVARRDAADHERPAA